jgi:hypothetical protein
VEYPFQARKKQVAFRSVRARVGDGVRLRGKKIKDKSHKTKVNPHFNWLNFFTFIFLLLSFVLIFTHSKKKSFPQSPISPVYQLWILHSGTETHIPPILFALAMTRASSSPSHGQNPERYPLS